MEINYDFPRKMARKVIKDYNIKSVPVDIKIIIEGLGLKYVELDDPEYIDGVVMKIKGKFVFVLNKAKPLNRQRFTIAHELGHIFLKHELRDFYDPESAREEELQDETIGNKKPAKEIEADIFASELLVPYDFLKQHKNEINNLDLLSRTFLVSKDVMSIAVNNYWRYLARK